MLNPWVLNQLTQHWFNMQKIWLLNSWELALWQQNALQTLLIESMRWTQHSLEISNQPTTLFRYARMNWLKPYEALTTHSVASTRLASHLWIQTLSAWQDGWKIITRIE